MNWPAYPEYRSSQAEWLDQVPLHWIDSVVGRQLQEIDVRRSDRSELELLSVSISKGVVPRAGLVEGKGPRADDLSKYKICRNGDVVVNRMSAYQGALGIARQDGIVSPDYMVSRSIADVNTGYLTLLFKTPWFVSHMASRVRGIGSIELGTVRTPRINANSFMRIPIVLPSRKEQDRITEFLDRETGKIDALIDKQHQLIATLREDRTATITNAVTKGLNPNAEMKDSGVEWLGMVPTAWTLQRMSWLFNTISSGTTPSSDRPEYYGGDINWVTTGELRESTIYDTKKKVTRQALIEHSPLVVYPAGSLLIAMYGATIGRLGILGEPACTNQACTVFSGATGVSNSFAFYALLAAREHLILLASGGGQPNINQEKLRSLRIAVPTFNEQHSIVNYLERECGRVDALLDESAQVITTLREYRSALITAAVTGKIDVRGAV